MRFSCSLMYYLKLFCLSLFHVFNFQRANLRSLYNKTTTTKKKFKDFKLYCPFKACWFLSSLLFFTLNRFLCYIWFYIAFDFYLIINILKRFNLKSWNHIRINIVLYNDHYFVHFVFICILYYFIFYACKLEFIRYYYNSIFVLT